MDHGGLMKSVIKSGMPAALAIVFLLLAPTFAVPVENAASNIPDGNAVLQSYAGNCPGNGSCEIPRGFKNNATAKVEIIKEGSGFALNGKEFHVVSLIIKSKINIQPSKVRDLLRSRDINNKTLNEIKNEIRAMAGKPTYNGSLRFGDNGYRLINIDMTSVAGNNLTLNADLLPQVNGTTQKSVAGHVTVTTVRHEGSVVGSGELTLNGVNYQILINMMPVHRGAVLMHRGYASGKPGARQGNYR